MQREKLLQFSRAHPLAEGIFGVGDDVEVHHRHVHFRQIALLTEQPAIDHDLRPVEGAVVGRNTADIATMGFDFFEPIALRVIAIGAATDQERLVAATQWQLGQVASPPAINHRLVTRDTFLGGR